MMLIKIPYVRKEYERFTAKKWTRSKQVLINLAVLIATVLAVFFKERLQAVGIDSFEDLMAVLVVNLAALNTLLRFVAVIPIGPKDVRRRGPRKKTRKGKTDE